MLVALDFSIWGSQISVCDFRVFLRSHSPVAPPALRAAGFCFDGTWPPHFMAGPHGHHLQPKTSILEDVAEMDAIPLSGLAADSEKKEIPRVSTGTNTTMSARQENLVQKKWDWLLVAPTCLALKGLGSDIKFARGKLASFVGSPMGRTLHKPIICRSHSVTTPLSSR